MSIDSAFTYGKVVSAKSSKYIRYLDGDILVDDDPRQIEYVRSIGKCGFLISPYIKSQAVNGEELERLHAMILHETEFLIDRKIDKTPQTRQKTGGGAKNPLPYDNLREQPLNL